MALYIGNDCVNVSSGAVVASDEHGYKEWIVTFPSRITSGRVVLATDEEIAKHYTDAQAMAKIQHIGEETNIEYHDVIALSAYNELIGSYGAIPEMYGMGLYRSSSGNGLLYQGAPLSEGKIVSGFFYVDSSGCLCYHTSTSRALCNSDYKIQFWW